jgi:Tfp pilus assembly protein PilE
MEPMMKMRRSKKSNNELGVTLLEMMLTVAAVSMLMAVAAVSYMSYIAEARRTEGRLGLHDVARLQKAYRIDHGMYASNIMELGFTVENGKLLNPNTYKGQKYYYTTSWRDDDGNSYKAMAVGNIDGDGFNDVLLIFK